MDDMILKSINEAWDDGFNVGCELMARSIKGALVMGVELNADLISHLHDTIRQSMEGAK